MRKQIILIGVFAVCTASSSLGLKGGEFLQKRTDQDEAVAKDYAHWDTHNKSFVWGSAEAVALANVGIGEILEPVPARKPRVRP